LTGERHTRRVVGGQSFWFLQGWVCCDCTALNFPGSLLMMLMADPDLLCDATPVQTLKVG
jgi:hypothetical protein